MSNRLFARLRRAGFDCECPHCGKVYIVRPAARTYSAGQYTQRQARIFDERSGIFKCTNQKCLRAYVLGLNFYPLGRAVHKGRVAVDTVPTLEQAREIGELEAEHAEQIGGKAGTRAANRARARKQLNEEVREERPEVRSQVLRKVRRGEGRVPKGAGYPVNTGPGCTCPERAWGAGVSRAGRDVKCPRHGGEPPEGE